MDGLPAEFVLGKGEKPPSKGMMDAMPYTQTLLSSGRAIGYHAKAAPPTVTMPRLKVKYYAGETYAFDSMNGFLICRRILFL